MTRRSRGWLRWLGGSGGIVIALALAGCVGDRFPAGTGAGAQSAGKDIVTASDEPEASRRARIRMELAAGYYARGQLTTALDEVKLALVADPNLAQAYNMRGLVYGSMGEEKLAEESFQRALQLDPRDGDTLQNYGYFLCQKRRHDEAIAMFDRALALPRYASAPRTLLTKGVCEASAGRLAQAEASLSKAYALEPTNPSIAANLSDVLFKRGDYERARFYIRRVNAIAALQGPQTLWLAARIEQRLGNRSGAREFGEQLRHRFPDSPEAGRYERGQFNE